MQKRAIPDSVLMYASVFTYQKMLRRTVLDTPIAWDKVQSYERNDYTSYSSEFRSYQLIHLFCVCFLTS